MGCTTWCLDQMDVTDLHPQGVQTSILSKHLRAVYFTQVDPCPSHMDGSHDVPASGPELGFLGAYTSGRCWWYQTLSGLVKRLKPEG